MIQLRYLLVLSIRLDWAENGWNPGLTAMQFMFRWYSSSFYQHSKCDVSSYCRQIHGNVWRLCHTFPGRLRGFLRAWIFQHAEKFCGQTNILKSYVYFPSRMRGTRVSVASVLRGMRGTPGDGVWKLRVRYGQHTCTARYGRVNSVVNVRELRARCEGTWTYKNERFSRYWETIYQCWEIRMISRYCKRLDGFTDVGNYLPITEITFSYRYSFP